MCAWKSPFVTQTDTVSGHVTLEDHEGPMLEREFKSADLSGLRCVRKSG